MNPDAYARAAKLDRLGKVVPESIQPPPILPGYEVWIADFFDLSFDRRSGEFPEPISNRSIREHTRGWPTWEAGLFQKVIRALDVVYLTKGKSQLPADEEASARDKFRSSMKR